MARLDLAQDFVLEGDESLFAICRADGPDHFRQLMKLLHDAAEKHSASEPSPSENGNIVLLLPDAVIRRDLKQEELKSLLQRVNWLFCTTGADLLTAPSNDCLAPNCELSFGELSETLNEAIAGNLVSLAYQPIFDVKTGQRVGYEALMRLRDGQGRNIAPSTFVPVAEKTGAIIELGYWAIDRACKDVILHDLGPVLTVNVSAVQLDAPGFPLKVAEIICRHGIAPQKLALEVTEGIDILLGAQAQANIKHIRRLGVQVWLDDFGTGFAGLSWLRSFEFDVVKVDRGFLHDCLDNRGEDMLRDIVRLLANRGCVVLVEGVETSEQLAVISRLGVDFMQGYMLGRPAPVLNVAK